MMDIQLLTTWTLDPVSFDVIALWSAVTTWIDSTADVFIIATRDKFAKVWAAFRLHRFILWTNYEMRR